jgi:hypothetical protein
MVAAMLGVPLMAWQQYVADVILEIDPESGELAYDEWVLTVPRQSGKSTLILAKFAHRCSATGFFGRRQQVAYTAQTRKDSRKKWEEDFSPPLKRARRLGATVHKGNGNEHTRFPNGSRFGIESTTEKAGHGGTLDEAFVDEAFAQIDNRTEQAFGPAMITRRNKQLGVVSTAGWLDASPYLLGKVQVGRKLVEADVRRGTAYFEWSAPDDADPADVHVWLECMPALHRPECGRECREHTVTIKAIQAEFDKARQSGKLSDFCRAYLNQWKPKPRDGEETALGDWSACGAVLDTAPKPEAIGLAVSLDGDSGSIAAATVLESGRVFVAAVDRRPIELADEADESRTLWLITEAKRIQDLYQCAVAVDLKGPAGTLVPRLEEAGVKVTTAKLEDYVQACADMVEDVRTRTLAHMGHPDLDEAVLGARWRTVGDRRVFGRKQSVSDIAMLEAATLAAWGLRANYDILNSFH